MEVAAGAAGTSKDTIIIEVMAMEVELVNEAEPMIMP
jgi:hypothetical protein